METDLEASLKGQAEIWKSVFSFADSMALKCAVELRIADIIHSRGGSVTLSQIVADIPDASSPDIPCLERIMKLLVRRNIFLVHSPSDDSGEETLYGLTHSSRWLLQDKSMNQDTPGLSSLVLMMSNPWLMAPWHYFSTCVKKGGNSFHRAHGKKVWEFASENSEFNKMYNDCMEGLARVELGTILSICKDEFDDLKSLVDVAGGTGTGVAGIVKLHPQIEGINFDQPHVVVTAPAWPGVRHVGGDMFESIPGADAVFIKSVLHNWGDEDCVKILKNCRKVIPEKSGKVIIVDVVLEREGNGMYDDNILMLDLVMMVNYSGGKQRTRSQWDKILNQSGFPRYNIRKIPDMKSIIQAYPV